jgi:hypothetical protein
VTKDCDAQGTLRDIDLAQYQVVLVSDRNLAGSAGSNRNLHSKMSVYEVVRQRLTVKRDLEWDRTVFQLIQKENRIVPMIVRQAHRRR